MCNNLRDGGPGPPATALTTPAVAALTQAVKPDIGSESRFLPTPPAFDAPVRGVPVGILLCRLASEKLKWCGYPKLKKFEDIFISFDMIHESDRHTHRQTDGQTPHDGIGRPRLCIASRGKNENALINILCSI